jgi:ribosomal protein L36
MLEFHGGSSLLCSQHLRTSSMDGLHNQHVWSASASQLCTLTHPNCYAYSHLVRRRGRVVVVAATARHLTRRSVDHVRSSCRVTFSWRIIDALTLMTIHKHVGWGVTVVTVVAWAWSVHLWDHQFSKEKEATASCMASWIKLYMSNAYARHIYVCMGFWYTIWNVYASEHLV